MDKYSATMASTPSASALSAVLRCRGNIWARNPPTKRPATSAYSLGLAGGVVRDSPDEESAWEAFLRGERVFVGRRLAVAYECPRVDVKVRRGNDSEDICHPRLSQSPGRARSAVPGVLNALARQLTSTLSLNQPGMDQCSKIIQTMKYETSAAHICKTACARGGSEEPAGVFRVSMTPPCLMESTGQIPSVMLTGWATLRNTCLSLAALVSEFMFMKLEPEDAPQLLLNQQEDKITRNKGPQANGQTPSPTDRGSGQRITEDRPD